MTTTTTTCDFCDKRGLPVLPVRYAIAEEGSLAPQLTTPFAVHDLGGKKIPLEGRAYYTTRLLRSGYLYVYDEARKRWEGYFVSERGYFLSFDIKQPVSPAVTAAREPCTDEGHREIAACVTIRDPKNATKVWFGFSDVEWTPDVIEKHNAPAYRARHMRSLDVKTWLSSKQRPHAVALNQVKKTVTEYALAEQAGATAFKWSPFGYHGPKRHAENLINVAEKKLSPHGLVLALPDPAGIAQELAALMTWRTAQFMEQPERKYKLTIAGVIGQMEAAIKDDAQRQEQAAAQQLADYQLGQAGIGAMFKHVQESADRIRNTTPEQLERVADGEWKKYTLKYSEPDRTKWQEKFNAELKAFDIDLIAPLATGHVAWMKSTRMAHYFECNFDPKSAENGYVYTTLMGNLLSGTSDKKVCADIYTEWFMGEINDPKNLLLCGLSLNQNPVKDAILAASVNSTSWGGLPWDKVVEAFDKATATLIAGKPDAVGRLAGLVVGPIANALRLGAQSDKIYSGLVTIGAAARQPIVRVEVIGGKKAFRALLIKELLRQSGAHLTPNKIQLAVAAELKRLQVLGVKLDGNEKKYWLLMIDPAEVRKMPRDLSPQARAQWLAKTIRTPEDIEALNLYKHRQKMERVTKQSINATPMGFAILGIVANTVALYSVLDEDAKALQHTKSESLRRVYAQGAQVLGAGAAAIEVGLEKFVIPIMSYGRGVASMFKSLAGFAGKFFGVGGSLAMGLWDLWRAGTELSEKNYSGTIAFAISGALGIAATVLLAIGWTGWGLIAVIALIAWSFIMTHLIDNKLQDWLERCVWGSLTQQRYNDLKRELDELKVATS